MAISGVGKTVKFALSTTKEALTQRNDKILERVEVYLDRQTGTLIIVPEEKDLEVSDNMFLFDFK